ncbi:TVP38/TMEM64 family protein [Alicyclobacillus contaminans]|uniref:TVP38/TMEM64 family protein n=1 Tax=Alicyclobacillus contaminans TaxID=392016 RepID=UPI0003FC4C07|nr:VTT domain-containing protein [Alicyclobacillus contaminans]GMA51213.1 TVP38/TMEM64 family protein [Alicyclobacillus contaminans]
MSSNRGFRVPEAFAEQETDTAAAPRLSKGVSALWSAVILVVGVALMIVFFHLDRHDQISNMIRASGGLGIVLSILLMALFCVIPVPSEFLMIMNMKVFGVWWGIFYTWVGAMLGALLVFWFARTVGRHLLEAFVSPERLRQVNRWITHRGPLGLLLVRLVPLPFIVVNYAAGVLKSVRVLDYIWTTGIGLLPYDLGAALVFLGVSTRFHHYLVLGGIVVSAVWVGGYLYNRYVNKAQRWAH